ncbi:MAG TPA: MOSC domain-containing protein [Euzebyales bacterium]
MSNAHITHCNVATPRSKVVGNGIVQTAIDKHPTDGPVEVDMEGFVTDQVGDTRHHGGNEQALYAFAGEDYDHWERELGRALRPGTFGDNLTTRGIDVNAALIGERWRIGTVTVEVSGPRIPCATFGAQVGEQAWPRRFGALDRTGAYLRVIAPGRIGPGDEIIVLDRPDHDVTVSDTHRIHRRDRGEAARLIDLPGLVSSMAAWARRQAFAAG